LRNLGVYISVSGSYLFKGPSVGNALMNLLNKNTHSSFLIRDFCRTRDEAPLLVYNKSCSLQEVLLAIEQGSYGFVLVEDEHQQFMGLVSMADVRRCLIRSNKTMSEIYLDDLLNPNTVVVRSNDNVREMLGLIRKQKFPITYLPVLDEQGRTFGLLSFVNLIKGEL
jgi:predicted transcriptional regulator